MKKRRAFVRPAVNRSGWKTEVAKFGLSGNNPDVWPPYTPTPISDLRPWLFYRENNSTRSYTLFQIKIFTAVSVIQMLSNAFINFN